MGSDVNGSHASRISEIFRRIASILLIICFALVATGTLISYVVTRTITSPQNYVEISKKTELAKRGRSFLVDLMITYSLSAQSGQDVSFLQRYSMQTWESIADVTVSIPWLETNLQNILLQSVGWVNADDTHLPVINIDLTAIRDVFKSPQGALVILPLMADIPRCPPQTTKIVLMDKNLVNCLPENYDLTKLAQLISNSIAGGFPDNISVSRLQLLGLITTETEQILNRVRISIHVAELAVSLGFRVSLLLFCLYTILHSSSLTRLVRSLPWPLYTAGVLSILLLAVWHFILQWGVGLSLSTSLPGLGIEAQTLLIDIARTLSGMIESQWLRGSLALIGSAIFIQLLTIGIGQLQKRRFKTTDQGKFRPIRIRKQFR